MPSHVKSGAPWANAQETKTRSGPLIRGFIKTAIDIVTGFLATASFRITCYNVIEAASTRDPDKRVQLVRLLRRLAPAEFEELTAEPLWWIYLAAYGYAFHQRSIRRDGFGRGRHAGAIDLGQAVDLPMCDRFVTNDRPQYRALRLLNRLNTKRRTEVLRYSEFRARLLVL